MTWALACSPPLRGMAAVRVQDGQGGQPGQDLVLADVQVLRPARAGAGGAGVAVAAPVGGLAVGPGRLQPPPAPAAGQQPGQQVPPRRRARRAARRAGVLGGDVIGLADHRPVSRAGGDHPIRRSPRSRPARKTRSAGRRDHGWLPGGARCARPMPQAYPRPCRQAFPVPDDREPSIQQPPLQTATAGPGRTEPNVTSGPAKDPAASRGVQAERLERARQAAPGQGPAEIEPHPDLLDSSGGT